MRIRDVVKVYNFCGEKLYGGFVWENVYIVIDCVVINSKFVFCKIMNDGIIFYFVGIVVFYFFLLVIFAFGEFYEFFYCYFVC